MFRKPKLHIVFALSMILLISLSACGKEKPEMLDWAVARDHANHGALSEAGYYYVDNSFLCYADIAAEASTVLCTKAACGHNSDSCDAHMSGGANLALYYWDEHVYYISVSEPTLYSRNATGMDLKKIGALATKYIEEHKGIAIGACTIADGYLYYEADISDKVIDKNGVKTTQLVMQSIGRINLSTGKDEVLAEENIDKTSEKLQLCAVKGKELLTFHWEGTDADRMDPDYITAIRSIPVTLHYRNTATGETKVVFQKTMEDCSEIIMVSGENVYYKAMSTTNTENAGYIYSYNMSTGEDMLACGEYARWYLGGGYVQCNYQVPEIYIFNINTSKRMPYELTGTGIVYNTSNKGFVLCLIPVGEEKKERRVYYVPHKALSDGLQETDLQYLYSC